MNSKKCKFCFLRLNWCKFIAYAIYITEGYGSSELRKSSRMFGCLGSTFSGYVKGELNCKLKRAFRISFISQIDSVKAKE